MSVEGDEVAINLARSVEMSVINFCAFNYEFYNFTELIITHIIMLHKLTIKFIITMIFILTRLPSSGIRTTGLLTVSQNALRQGVYLPGGGVPARWGCTCRRGVIKI